jgi:hypothetical protein
MTKDQLLRERLSIDYKIATFKRGEGSLTALKAYQRKIYAAYCSAK